MKVYIGKGIKYYSNLGVAEFVIETQSLHVGDEIVITGPTTGAIMTTVEEIRVDLKPVEEAVKGDHFSIKLGQKSVRRTNSINGFLPKHSNDER